MNTIFRALATIFIIVSCSNTNQLKSIKHTSSTNLKTAYFASGCFWCVEAIYESLDGVTNVVSGYTGGHTQNPTYESSNTGKTGHAEAVSVTYNPQKISFEELIDVYFASQDPTQINGQGNDIGSQYRSILFYQNETEKATIDSKKEVLSKKLKKPIAAEIQKFKKFWIAEDYHQNYVKIHPNQPYVKGVSIPRLNEFKRTCDINIKQKLK